MKSMARELGRASLTGLIPRLGHRVCTYAQTWDPMSGMTVKRAVSSLRRTHAIFSSDESAAVSSWASVSHCGEGADGSSEGTCPEWRHWVHRDLLANVRIFFSSVRNRILYDSLQARARCAAVSYPSARAGCVRLKRGRDALAAAHSRKVRWGCLAQTTQLPA